MKFTISDPLSLVAAQSGNSATSTKAEGAAANQNLTGEIESVQLGEPIPIVFCRRRTVGSTTHGGVYIEPKATEAKYVVNTSNLALSFAYLLVLSDGELPTLEIQDIYQHTCREGDTFNQKYDGRAGTWEPESNISDISLGPSKYGVPSYLGTGGSYKNLTTFSFEGSSFLGDKTWNRKVFISVKQGMKVTRLLDSVNGPSDNFVDLANYLLAQSGSVLSDLIDTTGFTDAAEFTDANRFFYNGVLSQAQNLSDWLQRTADSFLLRFAQEDGKFTFKPRLPANSDGTINTGVIKPEYTFTEDHLLPDGFEIEYIPVEDRSPVCAVMLWRQQPEDDFGIVRSTEVRINNEAANGPFMQYDLSAFCTTENHAVKVGVYHLARRKLISHNLRILVRAGNYAQFLSVGDIVRVRLRRETAVEQVEHHDRLYEIERIERSSGGQISYDLTHFPINSQGQSTIALAVDGAVGQGYTVANSGTDNLCGSNYGNSGSVGGSSRYDSQDVQNNNPNVPDDVPQPSEINHNSPPPVSFNVNEEPAPPYGPDDISNPSNLNDPIEADLDNTYSITGYSGAKPVVGDALEFAPGGCPGAYTEWFGIDINTGERTKIGTGTLNITADLVSLPYEIYGVGRCPDPNSPDGYADPIESDTIDWFQDINSGSLPCSVQFGQQTEPLGAPNIVNTQRSYQIGNAYPKRVKIRYVIGNEPYKDPSILTVKWYDDEADEWAYATDYLLGFPGEWDKAQFLYVTPPSTVGNATSVLLEVRRTSWESYYGLRVVCG